MLVYIFAVTCCEMSQYFVLLPFFLSLQYIFFPYMVEFHYTNAMTINGGAIFVFSDQGVALSIISCLYYYIIGVHTRELLFWSRHGVACIGITFWDYMLVKPGLNLRGFPRLKGTKALSSFDWFHSKTKLSFYFCLFTPPPWSRSRWKPYTPPDKIRKKYYLQYIYNNAIYST